MKNRAKSNIISIRLDEETYSRLLKAEKKYQKPISTMVRNFIIDGLLSVNEEKTDLYDVIEDQQKEIDNMRRLINQVSKLTDIK